MDILLEGGNWQCGICAGYLRTSFSHVEAFRHKLCYPVSLYMEVDSYDDLSSLQAAILKAKRARERGRTKAILNRVEMVIGRK